jgi:excisionase family DNA binding protein
MLSEPLLTIKEAAELLRLSPRTLYVLVETRRIPFVRIGRAVRFDRETLIDFLAGDIA